LTYFVPDEFYQTYPVLTNCSVAHGDAGASMTVANPCPWEVGQGLRPALALLPQSLLVHVVSPHVALWLVSVCYCLAFDVAVDRLNVSWRTKVALLTCWSVVYILPRFLIHVPVALCALATLYYVQGGKRHGLSSVVAAAVACTLRPVAATWAVPVVLWQVGRRAVSLGAVAVVAGAAVVLSVVTDSVAAGRVHSSLLAFVQFNVLSGGASQYGTHPWHWYLSSALPTCLGILTVPFALAVYDAVAGRRTPLSPLERASFLMVAGSTIVLSFIPHKEFRFLFPVVPAAVAIAAHRIDSLSRHPLAKVAVVVQTIATCYLCFGHQSGVMRVASMTVPAGPVRAFVAMPCHSLPGPSFFPPNLFLRQLWCPPPHVGYPTNLVTETDRFYADPTAFLDAECATSPDSHCPPILILFDSLLPTLRPWMQERGYRERERIFNALFVEDDRKGKEVVVWEREVGG
jgi:phosphatidylinositol glycan class B